MIWAPDLNGSLPSITTPSIHTFTLLCGEWIGREFRFGYQGNTFVRACGGGQKKLLLKHWAIVLRQMPTRRTAAKRFKPVTRLSTASSNGATRAPLPTLW